MSKYFPDYNIRTKKTQPFHAFADANYTWRVYNLQTKGSLEQRWNDYWHKKSLIGTCAEFKSIEDAVLEIRKKEIEDKALRKKDLL